jgi:hypothetical protein
MEPAILGLVLDSSIIIDAERKHQTVEELLNAIQQRFGEIEITMSAVSLPNSCTASLVPIRQSAANAGGPSSMS